MSAIARAVSRKSFVATISNACGSRRCSISNTALRAASNVTVRYGRARPRTMTFMGNETKGGANSAHLHLHALDFILDRAEDRMLAQGAQVRILGEPFEIAIAQRQRPLERRR